MSFKIGVEVKTQSQAWKSLLVEDTEVILKTNTVIREASQQLAQVDIDA